MSSFLPVIMLCGKKIDTKVVLGYLKIDRKSQRSLSCIMLKINKMPNGFVVKVVSLWLKPPPPIHHNGVALPKPFARKS